MTGIESANPMKSYQICVSLHQALGLGESFLPHETGDCWSGECQQLAQLDDNHGTKTWIPCDPLTSPLGVESKSSWAAFENSLWWPECSINSTALKAVESFKWCRAFHKTCSYDIYCYCNYVDYIGIYIYIGYIHTVFASRSKLDVNWSDPTKTALRRSQIVPKAVCLPWLQWSQILVRMAGLLTITCDHQHCKRMDMIRVQEHCTDTACPQVAAKSRRFITASGIDMIPGFSSYRLQYSQ